MSVNDQNTYEENLNTIFQQREVSDDEVLSIKKKPQSILRKKSLTKESRSRKDRIIKKLFMEQKKGWLVGWIFMAQGP